MILGKKINGRIVLNFTNSNNYSRTAQLEEKKRDLDSDNFSISFLERS